MVSISPINSQISFGRKKQDGESANKIKRPMIKWGDKGGKKSVSEKYGAEITNESARIIIGDYVLDKTIETGLSALVFAGALLNGKKLMRGVTGSFLDAAKMMTKNQDSAGAVKMVKKYVETVKNNVKTTKATHANAILEAAKNDKAMNAANIVVEGSVIDKLAAKADNDGSMVSKAVNLKPVKKLIAGGKENAENIGKISSDDVRSFLSKKGLTRGADAIDLGVATAGAGIAATGSRDVADIMTDLNDEQVEEKAHMANAAHYMKKFGKAASAFYDMI